MKKILRAGLGPALILCIFAASNAGSQTIGRIPIPSDVFYYQPASSVFGAAATWNNPGKLARFDGVDLQLIGDISDGAFLKSYGAVLLRDKTSVAYRHINNDAGSDFDEWIFAGAFPLGRYLQLGLSYRYFARGPDFYNHRHLWNLGIGGTTRGVFSYGVVLSNLNRGDIDGEQTEMDMRYSLGYRPFGPDFTVAVDMSLSTGTKLSNADWVYHAEYRPVPGLFINGFVDSDENIQLGVRANFLHWFFGNKTVVPDNGSTRSTVYAGLVSHRQPSLVGHRSRRLAMSLSGRPAENPPQPVFGRKRTPFIDLLTTIHRAADDPSVSEMLLKLRGLSLGFGQAQELRSAIEHFRSRGKTVVCHMTDAGNVSYYVASACDRILAMPVSRLNLVGLRAEQTFYAGSLDKIGVQIQLLRIGDYKTAAETWTRTEPTEENEAQLNRLLDNWYEQFVTAIAEGRGIAVDSMRAIIDNGPFTSVEAMKYGLIDSVSYAEDLSENHLDPMPEISFKRYQGDTLLNDDWRRAPLVAVVVAEGDITSDEGDVSPTGEPGGVTPSPMRQAFNRAKSDRDVKGIVLRVNSPGGSALAGDNIYNTARRAAEKKPMVVSMGNVGASGAYYFSMAAHTLYANPATVTGSIGIYGGKADLSGLYDKIDLGKRLYTRGRFSGMMTTMRPFTEAERGKYMSHLQAFYDHFVELVADNRGLSKDSIDALGRGRTFTGQEAAEHGLIDRTGGLLDAIDYMVDSLGLTDYRLKLYPERRPLFILPDFSPIDFVMSAFGGNDEGSTFASQLLPLAQGDFLLARLPYDLVVE